MTAGLSLVKCVLLVSCCGPLFGQGCSDAGFCTIGNLSQRRADSATHQQKIMLLLPAGAGDEGVFVFAPGIQYEYRFSKKWEMQAKVTANYARGNLGTAIGLGDFFLSGTRAFGLAKGWNVSATLGTKLPLNPGNLKENDRSLPMQYQSSLGTVDAVAGFSVSNRNWQVAAGFQQPLTGINCNTFLPEYWTDKDAGRYPPSNDFKRQGDVLLRTVYTFSLKQKLAVNAGLLALYHLGEDTYINANVSDDPVSIKGSEGLTLNVTLATSWVISASLSIGVSAGAPLVYRDVRPDGLTRSLTIAPEIRWSF